MKRKAHDMLERRRFELELKQIIEELKEDPLRKFNIAFALMGEHAWAPYNLYDKTPGER